MKKIFYFLSFLLTAIACTTAMEKNPPKKTEQTNGYIGLKLKGYHSKDSEKEYLGIQELQQKTHELVVEHIKNLEQDKDLPNPEEYPSQKDKYDEKLTQRCRTGLYLIHNKENYQLSNRMFNGETVPIHLTLAYLNEAAATINQNTGTNDALAFSEFLTKIGAQNNEESISGKFKEKVASLPTFAIVGYKVIGSQSAQKGFLNRFLVAELQYRTAGKRHDTIVDSKREKISTKPLHITLLQMKVKEKVYTALQDPLKNIINGLKSAFPPQDTYMISKETKQGSGVPDLRITLK